MVPDMPSSRMKDNFISRTTDNLIMNHEYLRFLTTRSGDPIINYLDSELTNRPSTKYLSVTDPTTMLAGILAERSFNDSYSTYIRQDITDTPNVVIDKKPPQNQIDSNEEESYDEQKKNDEEINQEQNQEQDQELEKEKEEPVRITSTSTDPDVVFMKNLLWHFEQDPSSDIHKMMKALREEQGQNTTPKQKPVPIFDVKSEGSPKRLKDIFYNLYNDFFDYKNPNTPERYIYGEGLQSVPVIIQFQYAGVGEVIEYVESNVVHLISKTDTGRYVLEKTSEYVTPVFNKVKSKIFQVGELIFNDKQLGWINDNYQSAPSGMKYLIDSATDGTIFLGGTKAIGTIGKFGSIALKPIAKKISPLVPLIENSEVKLVEFDRKVYHLNTKNPINDNFTKIQKQIDGKNYLEKTNHGVGIKYSENIVNKERLVNQLHAEQITKGHAFEKHILKQGEFPEWIRTKQQMQNYLENIFNDPKIEKVKVGNAIAYIDRKHSAVIYKNFKDPHGGTVFQPEGIFEVYLKKELGIE